MSTDEEPKETATLLGAEEDKDHEEKGEAAYGGAKPKVRHSTDDTRKRRRLLKKAHSIPQSSQSLLSTAGSKSADDPMEERALLPPEAPTKISGKPKNPTEGTSPPADEQDRGRSCPEFFGVRSYLHTFYESVSVGSPGVYDDSADPDFRYLIMPKKKRRMAIFWKITFWLGINLLILGLALILIGYLVPRRNVIVGMEAEMEIIDKAAMAFNKNLDLCKIVGLVVFCIGGTVLVAVLLFPSLMNQYCDDEMLTPSEGFKVNTCPPEPIQSPTEKKIPATEELSNVQPKRETVEASLVMTNSGLCPVP